MGKVGGALRSSTVFLVPRDRAVSSPRVTASIPPTRSHKVGFCGAARGGGRGREVKEEEHEREAFGSRHTHTHTQHTHTYTHTTCAPHLHEVLDHPSMRRPDQRDAPFGDGAARERLGLAPDLVHDDHLWRVVLDGLDLEHQ